MKLNILGRGNDNAEMGDRKTTSWLTKRTRRRRRIILLLHSPLQRVDLVRRDHHQLLQVVDAVVDHVADLACQLVRDDVLVVVLT